MKAAKANNEVKVKKLIAATVDANVADRPEYTVLILADYPDFVTILELL